MTLSFFFFSFFFLKQKGVNLSLHGVCGLGVFEETLANRSFDTFAQKARGNSLWSSFNFDTLGLVCVQQW